MRHTHPLPQAGRHQIEALALGPQSKREGQACDTQWLAVERVCAAAAAAAAAAAEGEDVGVCAGGGHQLCDERGLGLARVNKIFKKWK